MHESKQEKETSMSQLMEEILSRDNMTLAYKKVKANKGASGVDGISTDEIQEYLKENWPSIKERIQKRKYKPQPVLRVEIPKPRGGVRKLGIPSVVDRIIEQAIVQVITPIVEPYFSDYSYGFRPGRRAQQAVIKLLEYLNDGYTYIVDIDLEKFFDNVPQDKLMTLVGKIIGDPDTESLISKYLKAGVMVKGKYEATNVGTPQGGNLSPILSNIMLNELDRELEARGLNFVRYADDCVIAVGSSAAANRVMHTITKWIERKLRLKVNMTKTRVTKPSQLKYLGFGFVKMGDKWEARPHQDSVKNFERKLEKLTKRSWSISMDERIKRLNWVIRGWINYYRIGKMKSNLTRIDGRLRTRMRIVIWKQWKRVRTRYAMLKKLGIIDWVAREGANIRKGYWRCARNPIIAKAISAERLKKAGYFDSLDYYESVRV